MAPNAHPSIQMWVNVLTSVLIGCIDVPAAIAQPTPSPQTPPQPIPEQIKPSSYLGFGGVIGIQGNTTSLSQGTFSILAKHILTDNLAIHSDSTVFGSLTASTSIALTYNQPISSDSLPFTFVPFVGAGVMAYQENDLKISPMVTGGLDISTPTNLTLTVRGTAGFIRDRQADIGILFGAGFNY
jgi:hypothetical protein